MAQKKAAQPQKATLDTILSIVKHGFADLETKMERGFAAVAEDINDLKTEMTEQFDHVDSQFRANSITYALTDCTLKVHAPDGTTRDITNKAGTATAVPYDAITLS